MQLSNLENIITYSKLKDIFYKKRVVVFGSAPSCLDNDGQNIEKYDIIVRVNNYKTRGVYINGMAYDYTDRVGARTDYHFSYYGGSIKKTINELKADGIKGHLCKCPNDICHVTQWHIDNNSEFGGDFRWIYRKRKDFFFKPVYIPEKDHYMKLFNLLGKHVPTTGFSAIWEVLNCNPRELYVTGFDFMQSGVHNVNEGWKDGNQDDPIKHMYKTEMELFYKWSDENTCITLDNSLTNGKKIFKRNCIKTNDDK